MKSNTEQPKLAVDKTNSLLKVYALIKVKRITLHYHYRQFDFII